MLPSIDSERLLLRPWRSDDTAAALRIYGDVDVAHWLTPVLPRVADEDAMSRLLREWARTDEAAGEPEGHWAVEHREHRQALGGMAIRRLETGEDFEIGWQLAPTAWGHGYAAEAGRALAAWALAHSGLEELFALVRPHNRRGAATARRLGMEWVGETEKFHALRLQVFRIRTADLPATEEDTAITLSA